MGRLFGRDLRRKTGETGWAEYHTEGRVRSSNQGVSRSEAGNSGGRLNRLSRKRLSGPHAQHGPESSVVKEREGVDSAGSGLRAILNLQRMQGHRMTRWVNVLATGGGAMLRPRSVSPKDAPTDSIINESHESVKPD